MTTSSASTGRTLRCFAWWRTRPRASEPPARAARPQPRGPVHGSRTRLARGGHGKAGADLPFFRDASPVVDLGCGRGEFLELAARHGLEAHGVDTDADSVRRCRDIDLDAREENLFDHLGGLDAASVGGVFCSQVVEHLPPETIPV